MCYIADMELGLSKEDRIEIMQEIIRKIDLQLNKRKDIDISKLASISFDAVAEFIGENCKHKVENK